MECSDHRLDSLDEMFRLREEFMSLLRDTVPNSYPSWPVDPCKKQNQTMIRDIALRGVEEMFEALQHLKNSKPHRQTDMPDFDRESFVEETVDAFNYFLSMLVLVGVTPKELADAYKKKHDVIVERLRTGY